MPSRPCCCPSRWACQEVTISGPRGRDLRPAAADPALSGRPGPPRRSSLGHRGDPGPEVARFPLLRGRVRACCPARATPHPTCRLFRPADGRMVRPARAARRATTKPDSCRQPRSSRRMPATLSGPLEGAAAKVRSGLTAGGKRIRTIGTGARSPGLPERVNRLDPTAQNTYPADRGLLRSAAGRRGVRGRTVRPVPYPRYPLMVRLAFSRSGRARP